METRTKIILCLIILLSVFAYISFSSPYFPRTDPYRAIRSRMLTPGGETARIEGSVELSQTDYEGMKTQSYDYKVDGNSDLFTVSMPFQITKAKLNDRYWLDYSYKVYASERATVGNYTFYLVLEVGGYQTKQPVQVYVVKEIPSAPPESPWFVSLMLPLSFVFVLTLVYFLALIVKLAIDKRKGY